jgi:hypothetical protein
MRGKGEKTLVDALACQFLSCAVLLGYFFCPVSCRQHCCLHAAGRRRAWGWDVDGVGRKLAKLGSDWRAEVKLWAHRNKVGFQGGVAHV